MEIILSVAMICVALLIILVTMFIFGSIIIVIYASIYDYIEHRKNLKRLQNANKTNSK